MHLEFPLNGEYRMNLLMGKECCVSLLLLQSRTVTQLLLWMAHSCIRAQNCVIKSPEFKFSHKAENHKDLGLAALKK